MEKTLYSLGGYFGLAFRRPRLWIWGSPVQAGVAVPFAPFHTETRILRVRAPPLADKRQWFEGSRKGETQ
jgi:hypothetical protein